MQPTKQECQHYDISQYDIDGGCVALKGGQHERGRTHVKRLAHKKVDWGGMPA